MPKKRKKELRFLVDEDLHGALTALADRRGESVAEVCRRILKNEVEREAAEDGLDVITEVIRKTLSEVIKPTENRIAAMTAKSTIASGTSMYMYHHVLLSQGKDPRPIHEEARKKAVNFLKSDMNKIT